MTTEQGFFFCLFSEHHPFLTNLQWLHVNLYEAVFAVLLRKCVTVAKEVKLVVVSHMSQGMYGLDSGGRT